MISLLIIMWVLAALIYGALLFTIWLVDFLIRKLRQTFSRIRELAIRKRDLEANI